MPNTRSPLLDDAFARLTSAASHSASSHANPRRAPTPAQAVAGNYLKGRVKRHEWSHGLPLVIENDRNSIRRGESPDGTPWENRLAAIYGEIEGTIGADGDPIDVFIGHFPETRAVWIINQGRADGGFDEHKVMLGFQSEQAARDAYDMSFERGWKGMQSIHALDIDQLKWWLKQGDTTVAFGRDSLPLLDGATTMNKTLWTPDALPVSTTMPLLMYGIRSDDREGLMLDAVSMADIYADPDVTRAPTPMLDALVVEVNKLSRKMDILLATMSAAGSAITAKEYQISDPVKLRGTMQVAVLFQLSDGQTVTLWLHNPDTTPAKLMPLDELISWKWLLNKKDITIVVAPERGKDLNVREVARRIMKLAERNMEAFKRANAKLAERVESEFRLDAEIGVLEKTLEGLHTQIEVAKERSADAARSAALVAAETPVVVPEPVHVEGQFRYGLINRPVGIGTVPKGFVGTEAAPTDAADLARHGVVVYDRRLSAAEVSSFELAPVITGDEARTGVAENFVASLGEYGPRYAEMSREGADNDVADMLRPNYLKWSKANYGGPLAAGSWAEMAGRILGALVALHPEPLVEPAAAAPAPAAEPEVDPLDARRAAHLAQLEAMSDTDVHLVAMTAPLNHVVTPGAFKDDVIAKIMNNHPDDIDAAIAAHEAYKAAPTPALVDPGVLPEGWTEAAPGGMAAWNDPIRGGIVDQNKQSGQWFTVFNNDQLGDDRGFANRAEAFAAFAEGLGKITPAAIEPAAAEPAAGPRTFTLNGLEFIVAASFPDSEEGKAQANAFMEANTGTGVLAVENGLIIVADNSDTGRAPPTLDDKLAALVDAAYLFDSATKAFKVDVSGSIEETEYSPFASAKAIDQSAKANGLKVQWSVGSAVLDSVEALAPVADIEWPRSWLGFKVVDQAFVDARASETLPSANSIAGPVVLALTEEDASPLYVAGTVVGVSFTASKVRYSVAVALATQPKEGVTLYAVIHDIDSELVGPLADPLPTEGATVLDSVSDAAGESLVKVGAAEPVLDAVEPAKGEDEGAEKPAAEKPAAEEPAAEPKDDAPAEKPGAEKPDAATEPKEEPAAEEKPAAEEPKAEKPDGEEKPPAEEKKPEPKLDAIVDEDAEADALLDSATDGMIIGKIKRGASIIGRALIGGDGKAMIYVGKSGTDRVQFKSSIDGEKRSAMWSDDDAGLMVEWLIQTIEPETNYEAEWTRMTNADRGGLAFKAGFSGEGSTLSAKGERMVRMNWSSMGELWHRKLIAAWHGDFAKPPASDVSPAVVALEIARDAAATNEPINRAEGATDQADLEASTVAGIDAALDILAKEAAATQPEPVVEPTAIAPIVPTAPSKIEWEEAVFFAMSEQGDMSTSDAQGIADAQGAVLTQQYDAGATPEAAAAAVLAAATVPEPEPLAAAPIAEAPPVEAAAPPADGPGIDSTADRAYLESLIDGTGDVFAVDVFARLEPMFPKYEAVPDMKAVLEQAVEVYSAAATKAAQDALATPA